MPDALQSLVRVAQIPKRPGEGGERLNLGMLIIIEKGFSMVLLGVVEGDPLLTIDLGLSKMTQPHRHIAQAMVSLQDIHRVPQTACQYKQRFSKLLRCGEPRTVGIKTPKTS